MPCTLLSPAVRSLLVFAATVSGVCAQGNWRNVAGSGIATATGAGMALDPLGRIMRFGGGQLLSSGTVTQMSDTTQLFDGQDWQTVSGLSIAPSPRVDPLMVFDAGRQRTVLFGGVNATSNALNDTWEWDGAQWTQVFPVVSATPRFGAAIAYDGQNVILFAGFDTAGVGLLETWSYDGSTWNLLSLPVQPPTPYSPVMASGPGEILYFGGSPIGGVTTWRWNGAFWTQLATVGPPSWMSQMSMTFDPAGARYLLHGARLFSILQSDTWQFAAGQWSWITSLNAWEVFRLSHAFHPSTGRWVGTRPLIVQGASQQGVTSEFGTDLAYVSAYGGGCSVTTLTAPTLTLTDGQPRLGGSFTMALTPITGVGLFTFGWSATAGFFGTVPFSLAGLGTAVHCQLWHSTDLIEVMSGSSMTVTIPASPMLVGLEFYVQAFDLAPQGLAFLSVTRGFACGIDLN